MKTAWLFFWFALAAVEVGLAFSLHSFTFLAIGAAIPLMIVFNLQRAAAPGSGLTSAAEGSRSELSTDLAVPLTEELVHSQAA